MLGNDRMLFSSPVFWLGLVLIPLAVLLLDVIVKTCVSKNNSFISIAHTHYNINLELRSQCEKHGLEIADRSSQRARDSQIRPRRHFPRPRLQELVSRSNSYYNRITI